MDGNVFRWNRDRQLCTGAGFAQQRSSEHLHALAHSAQAVAFFAVGTEAIVLNFKAAASIVLLEPQAAGACLGMANHIGHAFPHDKRKHALLHGGKFNRGCSVTLNGQARGFERGLGLREFGGEAFGAVSANRVTNLGERLPGDFGDFQNFFAGSCRIAGDQLAGQFRFQGND